MLPKHLALVSQSTQVRFGEVAQIAAALQKQITRDFAPLWTVQATIDAFEKLKDVPSGYWPIMIKDDIHDAGAAGFHTDRHSQPYSLVQAGDGVAQTCSHEMLEMLADPFGNRMVTADSIKPGQGRVQYLVEVCDPSEDTRYGYTINGITVSDFYTPHFFDPVAASGVRYSYTGAITKPRQVLRGGYLSWMVPTTNEWWQASWFGAKLGYKSLSKLERKAGASWRETLDGLTFEPRRKLHGKPVRRTKSGDDSALFTGRPVAVAASASATTLEADIAHAQA
ncbi:MAG: hypothetical protein NVS9B10_28530 [Nevskia sp.]